MSSHVAGGVSSSRFVCNVCCFLVLLGSPGSVSLPLRGSASDGCTVTNSTIFCRNFAGDPTPLLVMGYASVEKRSHRLNLQGQVGVLPTPQGGSFATYGSASIYGCAFSAERVDFSSGSPLPFFSARFSFVFRQDLSRVPRPPPDYWTSGSPFYGSPTPPFYSSPGFLGFPPFPTSPSVTSYPPAPPPSVAFGGGLAFIVASHPRGCGSDKFGYGVESPTKEQFLEESVAVMIDTSYVRLNWGADFYSSAKPVTFLTEPLKPNVRYYASVFYDGQLGQMLVYLNTTPEQTPQPLLQTRLDLLSYLGDASDVRVGFSGGSDVAYNFEIVDNLDFRTGATALRFHGSAPTSFPPPASSSVPSSPMVTATSPPEPPTSPPNPSTSPPNPSTSPPNPSTSPPNPSTSPPNPSTSPQTPSTSSPAPSTAPASPLLPTPSLKPSQPLQPTTPPQSFADSPPSPPGPVAGSPSSPPGPSENTNATEPVDPNLAAESPPSSLSISRVFPPNSSGAGRGLGETLVIVLSGLLLHL